MGCVHCKDKDKLTPADSIVPPSASYGYGAQPGYGAEPSAYPRPGGGAIPNYNYHPPVGQVFGGATTSMHTGTLSRGGTGEAVTRVTPVTGEAVTGGYAQHR